MNADRSLDLLLNPRSSTFLEGDQVNHLIRIRLLAALALLIGVAGSFLTPAGNTFARVSPASGFWLLIFAFTLLLADVLTRLNLSPLARVGVLVLAAVAIGLLLMSGFCAARG